MNAAELRPREPLQRAAAPVLPLAPHPVREERGLRASSSTDINAWLKPALWIAALVIYPLVASPFFAYQIGAQTLVLGLIALSMAVLAGMGGMVSLSQMTVAGIAAYTVAIVGESSVASSGSAASSPRSSSSKAS